MYAHNMYFTNTKGPKNICVLKVENSSCDVDDDIDSFSLNLTVEEINMLYYSIPMRE